MPSCYAPLVSSLQLVSYFPVPDGSSKDLTGAVVGAFQTRDNVESDGEIAESWSGTDRNKL